MPANDRTTAADEHFVISRVFDAPRDLVWKAWTEPARLVAWLGPKGASRARIIRHELRPGGVLLTAMKVPNGPDMCGKFVYREVTPVSRLVWIHSFADEHGTLVRHPMSPTWPLELLTTVTFVERGDKTEVTLDWLPIGATDVERKTFKDGKPGMQGGWTGSFDQLADYLAKA